MSRWAHLKESSYSSRMVSHEILAVMSSRGEQRTSEQSRLLNEIPEQAGHIKPFQQEETADANPGNIQSQAHAT